MLVNFYPFWNVLKFGTEKLSILRTIQNKTTLFLFKSKRFQKNSFKLYSYMPSHSGPFFTLNHCVLCVSRSVVSDSLGPHGLQPARLLCP